MLFGSRRGNAPPLPLGCVKGVGMIIKIINIIKVIKVVIVVVIVVDRIK